MKHVSDDKEESLANNSMALPDSRKPFLLPPSTQRQTPYSSSVRLGSWCCRVIGAATLGIKDTSVEGAVAEPLG